MKIVPEKPIHLPGGSIPRNTVPAPDISPFRRNPDTPSDEQLSELFVINGGWVNLPRAIRAIWRAGCDEGMVSR